MLETQNRPTLLYTVALKKNYEYSFPMFKELLLQLFTVKMVIVYNTFPVTLCRVPDLVLVTLMFFRSICLQSCSPVVVQESPGSPQAINPDRLEIILTRNSGTSGGSAHHGYSSSSTLPLNSSLLIHPPTQL